MDYWLQPMQQSYKDQQVLYKLWELFPMLGVHAFLKYLSVFPSARSSHSAGLASL